MGLWENIRTDPSQGRLEGFTQETSGAPPGPSGTEQGVRETREGSEMANIGKSISIKGDVLGEEDTVIEGRVEGRVELKNHHLTVGPNGDVQGEIAAKQVTIVGRVAGNVVATERIELRDSGRLEGDMNTPRLLVQEGAKMNGKITMAAAPAAPTATRQAASPPPPRPEARSA